MLLEVFSYLDSLGNPRTKLIISFIIAFAKETREVKQRHYCYFLQAVTSVIVANVNIP